MLTFDFYKTLDLYSGFFAFLIFHVPYSLLLGYIYGMDPYYAAPVYFLFAPF